MVPPEIIIVPFVFGSFAMVASFRMLIKHKEKMAELNQGSRHTPAVDARLERVEQAIEAIAIEMERVGEGQRFLTRILSERQSLPDASETKRHRVNTPH